MSNFTTRHSKHIEVNTNDVRSLSRVVRRHWLISLILISGVITIAVHFLFKIKVPWEFIVAEWSAGDYLSFCGSIIGAIATIFVFQETIRTTGENQREERAFSIRPYFLIKAEKAPHTVDTDGYIFLNSCKNWDGNNDILIQLENVGAGNAVDVIAKIYQINESNSTQKTLPPLVVGRRHSLIVNRCSTKDLNLVLEYWDIAKIKHYCAKTVIQIICGSTGIIVSAENPEIQVILP